MNIYDFRNLIFELLIDPIAEMSSGRDVELACIMDALYITIDGKEFKLTVSEVKDD